jgi:hypothetical protein
VVTGAAVVGAAVLGVVIGAAVLGVVGAAVMGVVVGAAVMGVVVVEVGVVFSLTMTMTLGTPG